MPTLTHADAVLSLRDDPLLCAMSREALETEVATMLGTDDPLAIAMVIEEARAAGNAPPPRQPRPPAEGCRLERDCNGTAPMAANGRCLTCGANRGAPEPLRSDTEEPERAQSIAEPPPAIMGAERFEGPLTARFKAALGLTDAELGNLIGVSRPTAQAYASGKLPEIIDGIRADYMLRALRKRREMMHHVEEELEQKRMDSKFD